MPDIAMCEGKWCPSKHECYRFTAKPTEPRQAYAPFYKEVGADDQHCEYFQYTESNPFFSEKKEKP